MSKKPYIIPSKTNNKNMERFLHKNLSEIGEGGGGSFGGKYYGHFDTSEDLPEGDEPGYAYVGGNPSSIYDFTNGEWRDSGQTVDQSPVGNDEDIDQNGDGKLQFANRVNGMNTSGMNYVILRRNKTFAEQVTGTNTIYEIRDLFTISQNITLPANCVLFFLGGRISGQYTISGNNTKIFAPNSQIFSDGIILSGTWVCESAIPEWFLVDGSTDIAPYFSNLQVLSNRILLSNRTYQSQGFSLSGNHELVINGILELSSTINLNGFCSVSGSGRVRAYNCYAFTIDATQGVVRRIFVSGIKIEGQNTSGGGFICNGQAGGDNECSFCSFIGVSFYKCFYAFKGYFGGNNIEAKFENCHIAMDIIGGLNNIILQGQAATFVSDNDSAIYIDGNKNQITGRIWDIGGGNFQKTFITFSDTSTDNKVDTMYQVKSSNDSNGIFFYGSGFNVQMFGTALTPTYTYNNVIALNATQEGKLLTMQNPSWISLSRTDTTQEGYVDIEFATTTYFLSAIKMLFLSTTYALEKVEMYIGGTLYQTRYAYGLCDTLTLTPQDWNTFYNKNTGTTIKLRLFVPSGGARIRGMQFYQ